MTNNTNPAPVALVCSECGIGNYRRSALTDRVCCENCDHHIYSGDVDLEPGEVLTGTDGPRGALAYIPAAD